MCEPNDFYLRVFMFWFDTESIIPCILGLLLLSACRLRERRRRSRSVYVCGSYLELLRYVLCCAIER